MRKGIAAFLLVVFCLEASVFAKVDAKKAAYVGGTVTVYKDAKEPVKGRLEVKGEDALKFLSEDKKLKQDYTIPYKDVIDLEYGQKAGRRVGAAIATAVLLSPVGLFLLFSKKRKHYLTVGYKDAEGKEQAAIFELGKDTVRETLAVVQARSGKEVQYQDEEAKKSSKGN